MTKKFRNSVTSLGPCARAESKFNELGLSASRIFFRPVIKGRLVFSSKTVSTTIDLSALRTVKRKFRLSVYAERIDGQLCDSKNCAGINDKQDVNITPDHRKILRGDCETLQLVSGIAVRTHHRAQVRKAGFLLQNKEKQLNIIHRRQIQASRPADDQQHDDPHVHFTKSIAEKPSAVPPKKKLERRPTSGKGLLSIPLEELLDDSDSDDGELSVHSLASSSSFQVAPGATKTDTKAQDKKAVNWDKTAPVGKDSKKATDDSEDKGTASGAAQKPKKRVSSKFESQPTSTRN